MEQRRLLFIQFLLVLVIFALDFTALEYSLYWRLWWFDIPVHFLGGAWVAVAALWGGTLLGKRLSLPAVLAAVLAIGIGWELFELWTGMFPEDNYMVDTATDIIMDIAGGFLAMWATQKHIRA